MIRLSAALACALLAAPCFAQELSPKLDHAPLASLRRGQQPRLRAIVTSPIGRPIVEIAAYIRAAGLTRFSRAPLAPDAAVKDLFVVTLPDSLASADFDYYLEAFDADGNGPARAGSPEAPFHVQVLAPVAAPLPPTPAQHVQTILVTPAPAPPQPRSHALTATLSILGGLAVGCGAALALESESNKAELAAAQLNGWSFEESRYAENQTFATLSTVILSVGGALLLGALISGVVPSGEPDQPAPAPSPAVAPVVQVPPAAPAKEAPSP